MSTSHSHAVPDIRQSSNRRTGLLAVEGPIRDDVFDLTARHADIHELQVVQAVQLGAFPLSFAPFFAPFLKRTQYLLKRLKTSRVDPVVWAKPVVLKVVFIAAPP
jgi:hypothetical protein